MPSQFSELKAWKIFVRRVFPLRHVPFLDFVLGAGSMVLGLATQTSDFDVVIGARQGRIFTVRFFSALFLGVFGWRRKRLDHKESAAQKICLNHFVTPRAYRLSPPYNEYWKKMYAHLVPLVGAPDSIDIFLHENSDWVEHELRYKSDYRHRYRASLFARLLERLLSGPIGDQLEAFLKRYQIKRIERNFPADTELDRPRIRYTDDELEFHPRGWRDLPQR